VLDPPLPNALVLATGKVTPLSCLTAFRVFQVVVRNALHFFQTMSRGAVILCLSSCANGGTAITGQPYRHNCFRGKRVEDGGDSGGSTVAEQEWQREAQPAFPRQERHRLHAT
jgi:hypothetical protein